MFVILEPYLTVDCSCDISYMLEKNNLLAVACAFFQLFDDVVVMLSLYCDVG